MENKLETKFRERDEEEEEAEETLSFCDLLLSTCDSADFYTEEQSFPSLSSYSSSEDALFEFSISDLADYSSDYPSEKILFCGKLISPRKEIEGESKLKSNSVNWAKRVFSTKKGILKTEGNSKLRSNSVNWDKRVFSPKKEISKTEGKSNLNSKSVSWAKRVQEKLIFPKKEISKSELKSNSDNWVKRVEGKPGALPRRRAAAPADQQWPLLMSGSARFPASRRSSGARGGGNEREMKREKRLWAMVKALGCGGGYLAVA